MISHRGHGICVVRDSSSSPRETRAATLLTSDSGVAKGWKRVNDMSQWNLSVKVIAL